MAPNPARSLKDGALAPWAGTGGATFKQTLGVLARRYKFDLATPWGKLPKKTRDIIMHGEPGDGFEGAVKILERRYKETLSPEVRQELEHFMALRDCPACQGSRLRPETLAVKIAGRSISDVVRFSIKSARQFFDTLTLSERDAQIARRVLKEIRERLGFLAHVGLEYLTLDRAAATLSGGEGQRIRLATQIGSSLVGVLYILDEPSIGLHQRDNNRLLDTLKRLRDLGNTVLVVEHDEETIRAADFVVDLGPGAGELGGHLVAVGTPEEIAAHPASLTGKFLSGAEEIAVPTERRSPNGKHITIHNPREHNLKGMVLSDRTERYPRGALGDRIEAGAITVVDVAANALTVRSRYVVKAPAVIEDLIPIVAPIGEGRRPALVVVKSAGRQGSSVLVLGWREGGLEPLAEGPAFGLNHRWVHVIGAADVTGDGIPELLAVNTPHGPPRMKFGVYFSVGPIFDPDDQANV